MSNGLLLLLAILTFGGAVVAQLAGVWLAALYSRRAQREAVKATVAGAEMLSRLDALAVTTDITHKLVNGRYLATLRLVLEQAVRIARDNPNDMAAQGAALAAARQVQNFTDPS
jgi:hypothetical protein